ncbi:hypothetical protein TanjilG_28236 [Lupinus angustifolius]|uniref:Alpha-mannosidase n=1 Tax=Lupinus angustifolius TaxID=3871 RepID=A0A4P1REZ9_LUPAN|nr:hypothetical protein TanjilG_28236 [Lupinus angustifolius]
MAKSPSVRTGAPRLELLRTGPWCLGQNLCAKACVLWSECCVVPRADALMAMHCLAWAYLLGAELGFESVHFARIDYQDRAKRKGDKSLEVVWRGSRTFGSSAQIFANAFPVQYSAPSGFNFEVNSNDPPLQDDPLLFDYNVEQRIEDFINAATTQDGRVNALYSTPSIYTNAKNAANISWPLKTDDYFPYADGPFSYWTGFFTSRPALKGYVRFLSGYYLAARQLEFFAGKNSTISRTLELGDALGIAQHHDAVSGTAKQHTTNDYAKRLAIRASKAKAVVSSALACLSSKQSGNQCSEPASAFAQCQILNISYCPPTEDNIPETKSLVVVVYNPLGWNRTDIVRIPVNDVNLVVKDSYGNNIEAQHVDIDDEKVEMDLSRTAGLGKVTTLTFSSTSGQLKRMYNSRTGVDIPIQQSYLWYGSSEGDISDSQASGAYIFRPNGSPPTVVPRSTRIVVRLYKDKDHAEIEFTIGPIPIDYGVGKEVITRLTTNMVTNKEFYTDSNGRDFLKRINELKEVNLSANQDKSEIRKMTWKVEGDKGQESQVVRGGPVNSPEFIDDFI